MIADVLSGKARWAMERGDCRTLLAELPDASIDHAISDPPYSEHVHGKQKRTKKGAGVVAMDLGFASLAADQRATVARELGRLVRRWCLVFSDAESVQHWRSDLARSGLRHIRCGAWIKLNAQPQLSGDRPGVGFEAIQISHGSGRCAWNGGGLPGVWQHAVATDRSAGGARIHPTQKPLALMIDLVRQFTRPGDLVVDPYAGSGTTGVACLRLGRRFIGFERNPKWCADALRRLEAEAQGLDLDDADRGQLGLLGDQWPEGKGLGARTYRKLMAREVSHAGG